MCFCSGISWKFLEIIIHFLLNFERMKHKQYETCVFCDISYLFNSLKLSWWLFDLIIIIIHIFSGSLKSLKSKRRNLISSPINFHWDIDNLHCVMIHCRWWLNYTLFSCHFILHSTTETELSLDFRFFWEREKSSSSSRQDRESMLDYLIQ